MITRVLLRNWRGYEKLSLDLGPGLTFVIADNGVGKSSLVNGVAWAIFGDASGIDGEAAIRAGAAGTVAEVDFVVGDTNVSVARSLARSGRRRHSVTVSIDGEAVDPARLGPTLADVTNVPQEILPQLMFVPEMRLTHEGELFADVQDHLAALLGIDSLRRAARTAQEVSAETAKAIKAARDVKRLDREAVEAARAQAEELATEIDRLTTSVTQDEERREELDATLRHVRDWTRYDELLDVHRQRLEELADQARAVGLVADPDAVAEAQLDANRRSHEVTTALADARAEESLVRGLVDQLGTADAVCPVCLRPMDDDVARHASDAHRARLAEIEQREAAAEEWRREIERVASEVGVMASALARQHPPVPPEGPRPDADEAELLAQKTKLDRAIASTLAKLGALGEQLRQAQAAIASAERSGEAEAELTRLHAVGAAASSLAELANAEANARTERSLDPISRTLAERWREFFAGSGSSGAPRLAGGGSIQLGLGASQGEDRSQGLGARRGESLSQGLGDGSSEGVGDASGQGSGGGPGGATIPYSSFSGGEKTLASLLTRLLFVTSATELRSMWLDEPLEHLDPGNRVRVARLLAQVNGPDRHLRQMVVTTYEEGLARSMLARHDATDILYVSTTPLL